MRAKVLFSDILGTAKIDVGVITAELDNRNEIQNARRVFSPNKQLVLMRQVHGCSVHNITSTSRQSIIEGVDAQTTDQDISLGVRTADCVGLVFYNEKKNCIAACHAGYKGLLSGVIENTIRSMARVYGADVKYTHTYICPHIQKCCYNVTQATDDRVSRLARKCGNSVVSEKRGQTYLDLNSATLHILNKEGVNKNNITNTNDCTACNQKFPSHYRATYREKIKRVEAILTTITL